MASRGKAFSGRPTNSGSTIPRAVHIEGSVIGCHWCITSHWRCAPSSLDMRPTHLALSRMQGWRWWIVCMRGKAKWVGRMSADAGAFPECEVILW